MSLITIFIDNIIITREREREREQNQAAFVPLLLNFLENKAYIGTEYGGKSSKYPKSLTRATLIFASFI